MKKLGLVLCCLLVANTLWAAQLVDKIVAIVDGKIITLVDLNKRLVPYLSEFEHKNLSLEDKKQILSLKKQILNQMIDNMLLLNVAKKYKINVSDLEVKSYVDNLRRKQGLSNSEFQEQLKAEGLTYSEFLKKVKNNLLRYRVVNLLVKRKVIVTDQEIQAFYQKHLDRYQKKGEVCLQILVVPTLKEAQAIYAKLQSQQIDFNQAVQTYSLGPNKNQDGNLGCLHYSDLAKKWQKIIDSLKPGEYAKPFFDQGRAILLTLKQLKQSQIIPLAKVKEEIRKEIYQQKFEKLFDEFLTKLRKQALIEIRL